MILLFFLNRSNANFVDGMKLIILNMLEFLFLGLQKRIKKYDEEKREN